MSANESTNATNDKDKDRKELVGDKSVDGEVSLSLTPYRTTDPKLIARLWECADDSYEEEWKQRKQGFYALGDERFKDRIQVTAMVYPILHCTDIIHKHTRAYKEVCLPKNAEEELLPPMDKKREGDYTDPWNDGKFPSDFERGANPQKLREKILPETCIWVKCADCHGKGYKYTRGRNVRRCSYCGGTGMRGLVLCNECNGKGSKSEETCESSLCKTCWGDGIYRSVVKAIEGTDVVATSDCILKGVPDVVLPERMIRSSPNSQWSNMPRYKVLEISAANGRVILSSEKLKCFGVVAQKLQECLQDLQKKLDDGTAHYKSETIMIEFGIRYVKFDITIPNIGRTDSDFLECFRETKFPKEFFSQDHSCTGKITCWGDTLSPKDLLPELLLDSDDLEDGDQRRLIDYKGFDLGMFSDYPDPGRVLTLLLFQMSKTIGSAKKSPIPKVSKKRDSGSSSVSTKKRWLFIVLGLLLGFFGVHLLYAKRWFLFLLLWAGFITGNVCSDGKKPSGESTETAIVQTEDATAKPAKGNGAIGGIGFAVWGLLWLGGTFFIKKDGKGNRM